MSLLQNLTIGVLLLAQLAFSEPTSAFGFKFDPSNIKNLVISSSSLDEKMAYSFVRQTCGDSGSVDVVFNLVKQSAIESSRVIYTLDRDRAIQFYLRGGVSPFTRLILDSLGLHVALNECFGESSFAKGNYVLQLIAADLQGTAAGIGVYILGGKLIFVGVRWLASKLVAQSLSQMIQRSPYNTRLTRYLVGGIVGGAAAATTISTSYDKMWELEEKLKATANIDDDFTLKETEKAIVVSLENAKVTKGTNLHTFWKNRYLAKLNDMRTEITRLQTNKELSHEALSYWNFQYTKYAATGL